MAYKESALVIIFNDKGEIALQKRALDDKRYPGHWDFAAGGGIDEGEDPADAAVRETKEEIGADVEVTFLAQDLYDDGAVQDKIWIYRAQHNGPFTVDPVEVAEVKFFPVNVVDEMIKGGEKFHPEFPYIWKKGLFTSAGKSHTS